MDHRRGGRGAGRLIRARSLAFFVVLSAWAPSAGAQSFEAIGVRAQGMGGAFVAVADDASAVWWNPAGLAGGALFSAILERDVTTRPEDVDAAGRAGEPFLRGRHTGFSVAYPALGFSYFRLRIRQETIPTATDTPSSNRQDDGFAGVSLGALSISQYGATVGQSVGNHLVVSTTLKLLRGQSATEVVPAGEGSPARADELNRPGETHADLDLGVMARVGTVRVGLAVRNLRSPAFGAGADRLELRRRVRAGFAFTTAPSRIVNAVTVAADVDVTENDGPSGAERRVAAGAEAWLVNGRVGVRGGLSANTLDDGSRLLSGGLSVALLSGVYLDGYITETDGQGRGGWGSALRLTY